MHDIVVAGLPLLVILAGILLNRSESKSLRAEMSKSNLALFKLQAEIAGIHAQMTGFRAEIHAQMSSLRAEVASLRDEIGVLRGEVGILRAEMHDGFNRIDADLRHFYHLTGKLEGRMDAIERRK